MKKLSVRKFKRMMLVFLYLVAPASIAPLSGCSEKANSPTTSNNKNNILQPLNYNDGYYNKFPIQIYIDENFSEYNQNLIKTSLIELDKALEGLKFEYTEEKTTLNNPNYSYINIRFDEDGSLDTATAYKPYDSKSFAYMSTLPKEKDRNSTFTFESSITIGSYFTISEDIPESENLMGLELKWNNFKKFDAYVSTSAFTNDKFWNFFTSYNTFKRNIENALKGITKHEAVHALGYAGDFDDGFHSKSKKSLMYPYLVSGGAARKNVITSDVVKFMDKKYPKDKEMGD